MLSELQKEIITGNLLGDGCIKCLKPLQTNGTFVFLQRLANKEYVDALYEIYHPFSKAKWGGRSKKPTHVAGRISREKWGGEYCYYTAFNTMPSPMFTKYRFDWYKDPYEKRSQKLIPRDIKLSWRTLAIWMCDDGTNNVPSRQLTLYTDGFLGDDVEFIASKLWDDFGLVAKVYFRNKKPIVRMAGDSWFEFTSKIKEFIPWKCFQYKCQNFIKTDRHKLILKSNESGTVGVCYNKRRKKWRAYIYVNKKNIHLGWHVSRDGAIAARKQAEHKLLMN